jgi:two-component system CheB/CheR fusion protein
VLIYLEPDVQEKLLTAFHFALNPGGYLLLGSAEGTARHDELFVPVSKRRHIFQRTGSGKRQPLELRALQPVFGDVRQVSARTTPGPTAASLGDQQLLEHFAPPAVVVRRTGQIVRLYGAMDRYIQLPTGDATLDVLTLAREALKPTLRAALNDAVRHDRQKVLEALDIEQEKIRSTVRITVRPLGPATVDRLWLIVFEELPPSTRVTVERPALAGRIWFNSSKPRSAERGSSSSSCWSNNSRAATRS